MKGFQDWEANDPGRNVTVSHPDYVPPAPTDTEVDPDADLSLNARRLRDGGGGMSAHEVKHAEAELRGRRVA